MIIKRIMKYMAKRLMKNYKNTSKLMGKIIKEQMPLLKEMIFIRQLFRVPKKET